MCFVYFGFSFFSKDDAKKYTNNSVETKLSSSIGFENKECKGGFEIFLSGNTLYMWVQSRFQQDLAMKFSKLQSKFFKRHVLIQHNKLVRLYL